MLRAKILRGATVSLGLCSVAVLCAIGAIGASETLGARAARAQEPTPEGIEFVGSEIPGLDTIYLRGVGSTNPGGLLRVEVWANEVTDLYGLSFVLQFPQTHFRFPKMRSTVFVEGPFLGEGGGASTVLAVRQVGQEIIIGNTRTGQVPGVSGSGLLMTLEFRGLGVAGKKRFRLRRTNAFDSSGAVAEDYSWLSGQAIVTVSESPG